MSCPGGAKLVLVDGDDARMEPDALRAALDAAAPRGVHNVQRGAVSITQATEMGAVHSLDHLKALSTAAKAYDLPVHLDGARFSNAIAHLGCSPADMTWRAGIDALSFGGTKNGLMAVEAVVFFDPKHAWEFELRRKRGAHLFSKHRLLSSQMAVYLEDGLWLEMATLANRAATRLAEGMDRAAEVDLENRVEANMLFATMPRRLHVAAHEAGAKYLFHPGDGTLEGDPDERLMFRLVTNWATTDAEVDRFLTAIGGA